MSDEFLALERLGYSRYLEQLHDELAIDMDRVARVIAEHKGFYDIAMEGGVFRAVVTGRRMQTATSRDDYPAVGDWVTVQDDDGELKVIEEILPRTSTLRKRYGGKETAQLMVANVEVAFIVEAMDRDYNLNRFERYVVLAREGGVRPVMVLNKSDLLAEADLVARAEELRRRFGDVDVLTTSTVAEGGADVLKHYIRAGVTHCFLGSSGVGKSSLINRLLDEDRIKTQEIGDKTYRGRHTTTGREMHIMDGGGIIIDNPGSREVGVVDSDEGVKEAFDDIEELARDCRFGDCQHVSEPGCAVVAAVSSGVIEAGHYENYLKLAKEVAHYEASAQEKRRKEKAFGKLVKHGQEETKRYKGR